MDPMPGRRGQKRRGEKLVKERDASAATERDAFVLGSV